MRFETFEAFLDAIKFPADIPTTLEEKNCELCNSSDFTIIREFVDAGDDVQVPLLVKGCNQCGYIMQNPRPSPDFFEYYYNNFYSIRRSLSDKNKSINYALPSGEIPYESVKNQIDRAENIHKYICGKDISLKSGLRLFDVGCGAGGFLKYFQEQGFDVDGNDPDLMAVEAAKKFFDITISSAMSENFKYQGKYDIFLIMGSLEHSVDPNSVLESIAKGSKDGTLLIHEGRSFPLSYSYKFLNFNHHRYLLRDIACAMLAKHGFKTLISTDEPICGESLGRDGNGFVIAEYDSTFRPKDNNALIEYMRENNLITEPKAFKDFLDRHDARLDRAIQS